MSERISDKVIRETAGAKSDSGARLGELQSLSGEIVDLFYTQTFSPEAIATPSDVCKAFAEVVLRHWELCCITIYLRGDDGHLSESWMHADEFLDEAKARRIGQLLAAEVERGGREAHLWLDAPGDATEGADGEWRSVFEDAHMRAGVAVPINARGVLVGALVAATAHPERLREALNGLRFVAAPIVIAVGNARRAAAMLEQHRRIEHLVEELQRRSGALEEANTELRRVAHYRSLFLARMSHELRTPLTSILGFAEILIDHEKLTDAQRRFCEKIQSSGLQLQASLNQLVDLSRLEAGQEELFLHEFPLRETLRESCAAVARLAQKQEVKIDCVPDRSLPSVVSDEGKLRQVLYNFFAFAISRSAPGESIKIKAERMSPSRFRIMIEDSGEALDDLSGIFEPVDLSAPSEKATNMNELGLVIARRLIDVLDGTVALESSGGRGLKVMIELPTCPTKG